MILNLDEVRKKLVTENERLLSDHIKEIIENSVEESTSGLEGAADKANEAFEQLEKCVEGLDTTLEECNSKITVSVDVMNEMAKELSDIFDKFSKDIASANKSAKKLSEEQRKALEKSVSEINVIIQSFSDKILHADSNVNEAVKKYQAFQSEISVLANKSVEAQKNIKQQMEDFSVSMAGGVESVKNISAEFDMSASKTEKLVKSFQDHGEKIEAILSDFTKITEQISNNLTECEKNFKDKFESTAEILDASLNKCNVDISKALEEFNESSKSLISDFEIKFSEAASLNQSLKNDILRIEEWLKVYDQTFDASEMKKTKQFYILLGVMGVILLVQMIQFFL